MLSCGGDGIVLSAFSKVRNWPIARIVQQSEKESFWGRARIERSAHDWNAEPKFLIQKFIPKTTGLMPSTIVPRTASWSTLSASQSNHCISFEHCCNEYYVPCTTPYGSDKTIPNLALQWRHPERPSPVFRRFSRGEEKAIGHPVSQSISVSIVICDSINRY